MIIIKLVAITFILAVVPIALLIWQRKRLGEKFQRALRILALYLLIIFSIVYPIGEFGWAMERIERHFPYDCHIANKISKAHLENQYSWPNKILLSHWYGITPRLYFLSTVTVCEFSIGNQMDSKNALHELLTEKTSLISTVNNKELWASTLTRIKTGIEQLQANNKSHEAEPDSTREDSDVINFDLLNQTLKLDSEISE